MDGVVGPLIAGFLVVILVIAIVRFIVDVLRRDPEYRGSDTTIDMATGEVAGQGIAAAITAFLERLI